MKAHDDDHDRRGRGRKGTRARPAVRLALASELPWLGCYPVIAGGGLELRHPVTGARHVLDRPGLAAATRAIKRLVRDHAAALAAIVGDVERWQRTAVALLDALKPTIHDGAALPSAWSSALHAAAHLRRARQLIAAAPALTPVVEAIGWSHAAARKSPAAALSWLERHRDQIVSVLALCDASLRAVTPPSPPMRRGAPPIAVADSPVAVALLLHHLADEDGDRLVDPLIAALADPLLHTVSVNGRAHALALRDRVVAANRTVQPRPAPAQLGPALIGHLRLVATAAVDARRLGLRTVAVARLPELAAAWRDVWQRVDAIEHVMVHWREPTWAQLVALHRDVTALPVGLPAELNLTALLWALQAADRELLALLERLPALDVPGAAAEGLLGLHRWSQDECPQITTLIEACLGDEVAARWPLLWRRVIRPNLPYGWSPRPSSHDQARVVGTALTRVLSETDMATAGELTRIARRRAGVDDVVAHWRLCRERELLDPNELDIALAITTTTEQLRALAPAIHGHVGTRYQDEDDDEGPSDVARLIDTLGPAAHGLVRRLILAGEHARLRTAARTVASATMLKLARPPFTATDDDRALPIELVRYPPALHPLLARLAAADVTARAATILDDTFPDPRATAAELTAIEARLAARADDARLHRRAATLRARLASPPAVSAVRLERLRGKLERAADVAAFDRWHDALRGTVTARLIELLGLDPAAPPPWHDAPAYQRAFAGISQLHPDVRALARRLLASRTGPPPWDLRDEPANRAWLERVRARGVDVTPWLDGLGPRRHAAQPSPITLSLEDDPLEVLRMGEHFSTCLAPGAINFFAAVVDAAEINKRVIYGRDGDGNVVGRCLIGLTDAGGLVTFQPYCHHRCDFTAMIRAFVAELATRMGTLVVPAGTIAPLMGCDWYDDGPRDLTGAFGFLADGAPFRARLATIAPDELLAELTARFAPVPVGGLLLTLFAPLPELDARPELIVPCLPLLDASDDVPLETRLRAAQLAERAGRGELLGDRFIEHLRPTTIWWYANLDVLELIAPRAPARLLRWLHGSRAAVSEHDRPAWSYGHGLALAALHRPTQAATAFQLAARSGSNEIAGRARARLRSLALAHPRLAHLAEPQP